MQDDKIVSKVKIKDHLRRRSRHFDWPIEAIHEKREQDNLYI